MARDLRKELEMIGDEPSNTWHPEVGDVIVGRLVTYDQGSTKFGECRIAVLQEEPADGLCEVWLGHAVLKNEFERQQPRVGERVGIKRLADSDKGYKRYKLLIDREELQKSESDSTDATGEEIPF